MTVISSIDEAYENVRSLRFGNTGTVVGDLEMSDFADSLYVSDTIDHAAEEFFTTPDPDGEIFIITGSAGDGKSAIFARAFTQAVDNGTEWLEEEHINLDATASKHRDQSKIDDLNEFLEAAISDLEAEDGPRRGLAMNLGIALNFFEKSEYNSDGKFDEIWEAIEAARDPGNLDPDGIYSSENGVTIVNLSYRPIFTTTHDVKDFASGLLRKITDQFNYSTETAGSPFQEIEDLPDEPTDALRESDTPYFIHNLAALTDETVRERFATFVAARSLTHGQYLNPRHILAYIAEALIPDSLERLVNEAGPDATPHDAVTNHIDPAKPLIWNGIYAHAELEDHAATLDPCAAQSSEIDEKVLELTGGQPSDDLDHPLTGMNEMSQLDVARTWARAGYLRGTENIRILSDKQVFRRFIGTIAYLDDREQTTNGEAGDYTEEAFGKVVAALRAWSGQDTTSKWLKLDDGLPSSEYYFFAEWDDPGPDETASATLTTGETRPGTFWFKFDNGVEIPLTFRLYYLMELTSEGYNPNALDLEGSEGVRLIRSQISRFTEKEEEIEIRAGNGSRLFNIATRNFGSGITAGYLGDNDD
jgi:DNA phosphorothioation-dependent restriction protein DptF